MLRDTWQKSSASNPLGNCVDVAQDTHTVQIRDSKDWRYWGIDDRIISFDLPEYQRLVDAIDSLGMADTDPGDWLHVLDRWFTPAAPGLFTFHHPEDQGGLTLEYTLAEVIAFRLGFDRTDPQNLRLTPAEEAGAQRLLAYPTTLGTALTLGLQIESNRGWYL